MKTMFLFIALTVLNLKISAQQSNKNPYANQKLFDRPKILLPRFVAGLEAGPSISMLYGNTLINSHHPNPTVSAGTSFQYNFQRLFAHCIILSIKTGLYYDMKGEQLPASAGTNTETIKPLILNYITLPLLFQPSFYLKKHFSLFLNTGPYMSVLTHRDSPENTLGFINSIKILDAGLQVGFGFSILVSKHVQLTLEDRNSIGLVNISRSIILNNSSLRTFSSALLFGCHYLLEKS